MIDAVNEFNITEWAATIIPQELRGSEQQPQTDAAASSQRAGREPLPPGSVSCLRQFYAAGALLLSEAPVRLTEAPAASEPALTPAASSQTATEADAPTPAGAGREPVQPAAMEVPDFALPEEEPAQTDPFGAGCEPLPNAEESNVGTADVGGPQPVDIDPDDDDDIIQPVGPPHPEYTQEDLDHLRAVWQGGRTS